MMCSRCKQDKPETDEFWRRSYKTGNYLGTCLACLKQKQKVYEKNRKRVRNRSVSRKRHGDAFAILTSEQLDIIRQRIKNKLPIVETCNSMVTDNLLSSIGESRSEYEMEND